MTDELERPVFPAVPKLGLAPVDVVERSPTGLALLPQILVRIGTVVTAIAAIGIPIFSAMLPAPWAVTGVAVCTSICGLGAALGFASPGIRTQPGPQAVTTGIPNPTPSNPTRIGPKL